MLQLGIYPQDDDDDDITVGQAWDDIAQRTKHIFSDKVSLIGPKAISFLYK